MNTKSFVLLLTAGLLAAVSAPAGIDWDQTFTPANGTIPAGNLVGQPFTGDVTAAPAGTLVDGLEVSLNLSGGYNGDLYAYLVSPGGTTTDVLLNQPGVAINGFGASGSGINIILADNSPNGSIQNVTSSSPLSGSYRPASPLSAFDGGPANGIWTLYFADLGSGGGDPTLNSWSVGVTVVPEAETPALYRLFDIISICSVIGWLARRRKNLPTTIPI